MAAPPRDAAGVVIPHNDPDIGDADGVLRYIDPVYHLVYDDNTQRYIVSSGAFCESKDKYGGMSVDLEQSLHAAGLTSVSNAPEPSWGVARLEAGALRRMGMQVGSDPLPDINPHHGAVWDVGNSKRRRRIRDMATMLRDAVLPPA